MTSPGPVPSRRASPAVGRLRSHSSASHIGFQTRALQLCALQQVAKRPVLVVTSSWLHYFAPQGRIQRSSHIIPSFKRQRPVLCEIHNTRRSNTSPSKYVQVRCWCCGCVLALAHDSETSKRVPPKSGLEQAFTAQVQGCSTVTGGLQKPSKPIIIHYPDTDSLIIPETGAKHWGACYF